VGLGWLREEFEALDVPFERRRARLVEGIALMRKCWSESPVTFHGQEYTVDPAVHFVPRPGRPIPLYMGGNSDAALRRAADSAQGWIGHELAPAECRTMRSRIAAIGPGSIDPGFEMISSRLMNLPGLGEGEQGRFTITSSAALAAELRRYEDAGLDLLLCETTVRSGAAYERLIEELHAAGAQAGMLVA
jgi:alkanesulfonate monooxygenase SsuD/methylene tetrahydromethanopterin reductase-like flavin-dependent oxidoreductase (luciferase family)